MPEQQNMETETSTIANLQTQVQELQHQLDEMKTMNKAMWDLLVRIGNRLQLSSTSIKAAVSSLLDFDIFWDESTEHEFLQAIDDSINEMADSIVLMTLAFRSQARSLQIETEPNMIQEVLEVLQRDIAKNGNRLQIHLQYPPNGKPVLVDYQYLYVALKLLIEVIIDEMQETERVSIRANETGDCWHLNIDGLEAPIITIFHHFFEYPRDLSAYVSQILPENTLKLVTACRILYLQNINLCLPQASEETTSLCLIVPAIVESSERNEII